jgi:hypothetical protein
MALPQLIQVYKHLNLNLTREDTFPCLFTWLQSKIVQVMTMIYGTLDNSKDIFKYNYLVSKPNYLTFLLITIFYLYNYFTSFLITISYSYNYFTPFLTHQHGYEKTIMSMIFTLIETKFDIDINNDELLIIVWEPNN